jgi:putative membrane protein
LVVLVVAGAAHASLAKLMYAHQWPVGADHPVADLQRGAELMYYGGDLVELLLAGALFWSWYQVRKRRDERGVVMAAVDQSWRVPRRH